jgi:hypothetical protein
MTVGTINKTCSINKENQDFEWIQVTGKAPFAPRDGAGALVFNDRMWLLGGWMTAGADMINFPMTCNNEVFSSDDGINWVLEKPNTFLDKNFIPENDWEGRHTAGYAVFKDKMWLIGGDVNQGHYQYDVWSSSDGWKWRWVNKGKPVPWGPRALHYTVVFKDKIWIMGGQTLPQFAAADEIFYNDIWNSHDGISWKKVEPAGPHWSHRGMIGGSVVFNDRIWLLGGGTYDTDRHPERKIYNEVWSSSDGKKWEKHKNAPWFPRQYHDIAVFDNKMWVLEGWNRHNRNDVWYSSDGENWLELPHTPWAPRHAASVFVYKNALWVVAGNNMESDVWKLQRKLQPA